MLGAVVLALKLDLACGQSITEGFQGVDIVPGPGVDFAVDLEKFPWPWESNSVDEVICHQYIEHVRDIMGFMNELWRVMKPGAKAVLTAPYYSSIRAWQDPTHVRAISEHTFLYYMKDWREKEKLTHYPITADFAVKWNLYMNPDFINKSQEEREWAMKHFMNVADTIWVELTKRG